jgi:hypothetical protein
MAPGATLEQGLVTRELIGRQEVFLGSMKPILTFIFSEAHDRDTIDAEDEGF